MLSHFHIHTLHTSGNLQSLIYFQTRTSFVCGRKRKHPEESYTVTGRRWKLHTIAPEVRIGTRFLVLWCSSSASCATVLRSIEYFQQGREVWDAKLQSYLSTHVWQVFTTSKQAICPISPGQNWASSQLLSIKINFKTCPLTLNATLDDTNNVFFFA